MLGSAPQLLLSCCRFAQNCWPLALMHCVYEPVHANEQRPFRQDTMALGSVGHTLPHLPLCEPRQRYSVSEAIGVSEARRNLCSTALQPDKRALQEAHRAVMRHRSLATGIEPV